jgi:alpha-beta hydrolase superfamily lysophospholipase
MCRRKKKDYRTKLEKKGKELFFTMSDGAIVRVLDFDLAENPHEYTIFLIPGFITVFQGWEKVVKALVTDFRVIYFESREKFTSSLSRKLVRKLYFDRMGEDIKEVIATLELDKEKYVTLCSSTGGTIQAHALANKWINPTGAVMVGPAFDYKISLFVKIGATIVHPFLVKTLFFPLVRWYIANVYVDKEKEPEQLEKYIRAIEEADLRKTQTLLRKMRNYSCWELAPQIETETLLVGASADKMHQTESCLKAHKLIPNSTYVDLGSNKATHSQPLVEEMYKFIDYLEEKQRK